MYGMNIMPLQYFYKFDNISNTNQHGGIGIGRRYRVK
jgi:hypothetical protein